MASQRSPGTRDDTFMVCHDANSRRFCNTLQKPKAKSQKPKANS